MSNLMKGKALVIHIGDAETRVACLTLGAKIPQILAHAEMPTPAGAVEDGVIRDMDLLREELSALIAETPEFQRVRKAVYVLQSTQVISQTVSVPQIKKKKQVEQLVKTNADLYFPVDITGYQLTWQVVGHTNVDEAPMTQIQMWATPKNLLQKYYQLANSCGLSVVAVDYCGHSYASGINASFASAKVGKKAAKSKAADDQTREEETTTLFINLEKSHILMSFVQEEQVLLQRLFRRSDYLDTDLNEMFMEMEYFHAMFPACVSGDCVVSGSEVDDRELMTGLEDVANVPLQMLHCEPDQLWCMALGASLSELDYGSVEMNSRSAGTVSSKLGSPWQYALVAVSGAALIACLLLHLGSSQIWNTELQGLRSQQNMLMLQLAETGSAAKAYKEYDSLYKAYSQDWDTVFNAARTYNDNACLMLDEIESILPSSSVVTEMGMTEQSLALETFFKTKEDVVYFLVALRDLQYASLLEVSNLMTGEQWLAGQRASAQQAAANGSALMTMMQQLMGQMSGDAETAPTTEQAPVEGGFVEAAPTEGSAKNPLELYQDLMNGTLNPMELMTEEFVQAVRADDKANGRTEPDRLEDFMMDIALRHALGKLDLKNLTAEEKANLQQMLVIYAKVSGYGNLVPNLPDIDDVLNGNLGGGGNTEPEKPSGGSDNPGNPGNNNNTNTGSNNKDNNSGSIFDKIPVGGGNSFQPNPVPTGKELTDLLEKYELTEQHLKDGLDNLTAAAEMGVLDKHYSDLYDRYTLRSMWNKASLGQQREAIRATLEDDALSMHQFFLLMQEDLTRSGKQVALMDEIADDFWAIPELNQMIRSSDQAMLDKYLPKLMDILLKNGKTVEGTHSLVLFNYNLTRKLAGNLAVAMGKEKTYESEMDFDKLINDILSGKTHQDMELNTVIRKMLTPKALEYYNSIQTSSGSSGSGDAAGSIADILNQLLGGNTGNGGNAGQDVVLPELPGNYVITVTLGYKPDLILAEQARKGLDYAAKVEPVGLEADA